MTICKKDDIKGKTLIVRLHFRVHAYELFSRKGPGIKPQGIFPFENVGDHLLDNAGSSLKHADQRDKIDFPLSPVFFYRKNT